MTIEEYNQLSDKQKKYLLVDAEKIAEYVDDVASYELFRVDEFFIEVSKSVTYRFRKILNTYLLKDVPEKYLLSIKDTMGNKVLNNKS
jgi:hypothetical protein